MVHICFRAVWIARNICKGFVMNFCLDRIWKINL
jgi:hypothetical protein